jgi:hypothetical protein
MKKRNGRMKKKNIKFFNPLNFNPFKFNPFNLFIFIFLFFIFNFSFISLNFFNLSKFFPGVSCFSRACLFTDFSPVYACSAPIEPLIGLNVKKQLIRPGETFEVTAVYTDFDLAPDFEFDFFHNDSKEQSLFVTAGDPVKWAQGVFTVQDKRMLECLGNPPTPVSDAIWKVISHELSDSQGRKSAFDNPDYISLINNPVQKYWSEMPPEGYLGCLIPGNMPDIFLHPGALDLPDFMSRYSSASEKAENIIDTKGNTVEVVESRWISPCKWRVSELEFKWNGTALKRSFDDPPLDKSEEPEITVKNRGMSIICKYPDSAKPGKRLIACRARARVEITGTYTWYEIKNNIKSGPFFLKLKGQVYKNNYLENKVTENMTGTISMEIVK